MIVVQYGFYRGIICGRNGIFIQSFPPLSCSSAWRFWLHICCVINRKKYACFHSKLWRWRCLPSRLQNKFTTSMTTAIIYMRFLSIIVACFCISILYTRFIKESINRRWIRLRFPAEQRCFSLCWLCLRWCIRMATFRIISKPLTASIPSLSTATFASISS